MTAPILTRTQQRVYQLIFEAADAGAPAPGSGKFQSLLDVNSSDLKRCLRALADHALIMIERGPSNNSRRFYVPALDRWTGFSHPAKFRPTTRRKCITGCGAYFMSEGKHHRMCGACRSGKTLGPLDLPSLPGNGRITYARGGTA